MRTRSFAPRTLEEASVEARPEAMAPMNLRRESILRSEGRPGFPDLCGVPPRMPGHDDHQLHSVHRPEARMDGGQRIQRVALLGRDLDAADARGMELGERFLQSRV